jgi:CTP synthase (UTP-ammonia lyase)
VGEQQWVEIHPGTRARLLYGCSQAEEDYYCNYGVDPSYRRNLEQGGLTVSGTGASGEIRMIELTDHPFFVATLFLPQMRSTSVSPHPLIAGYATAVSAPRR